VANRARRRSSRRSRSALALRWVGALVLVAILVGYVHPLRSYRDANALVTERRADLSRLERETAELERELARASSEEFVVREARRLGLVRPGERLFIVTGVNERRARQGVEGVWIP
jgi:cell division protein FtsB